MGGNEPNTGLCLKGVTYAPYSFISKSPSRSYRFQSVPNRPPTVLQPPGFLSFYPPTGVSLDAVEDEAPHTFVKALCHVHGVQNVWRRVLQTTADD